MKTFKTYITEFATTSELPPEDRKHMRRHRVPMTDEAKAYWSKVLKAIAEKNPRVHKEDASTKGHRSIFGLSKKQMKHQLKHEAKRRESVWQAKKSARND